MMQNGTGLPITDWYHILMLRLSPLRIHKTDFQQVSNTRLVGYHVLSIVYPNLESKNFVVRQLQEKYLAANKRLHGFCRPGEGV